MAMTMMETTLSEYGLKVIDPTGEKFDAKLHEAIGYEESDDCEEDTRHHDRENRLPDWRASPQTGFCNPGKGIVWRREG